MVIAVMLLLFAGGIALVQGVSDPRAVTLRWLRLGSLISLGLLGVSLAVRWQQKDTAGLTAVGLAFLAAAGQLLLVQKGWRRSQRTAAGVTCVLASLIAGVLLAGGGPGRLTAALLASMPLSAGLLGGSLMTMLLGHAYLTAGGEMTQAPFRRLVLLLGGVVLLRLALSATTAAWPFFAAEANPYAGFARSWNVMMIAVRYGVGLIVPGVLLWMTDDCVRRRANQSATGILYVTTVLLCLGEGAALSLYRGTDLVF